MRASPLFSAVICANVLITPLCLLGQTAAPPQAKAPLGPRIVFLTNEYNFGKVMTGEIVKYSFIVSNAGDQTLEISRVTPGCHCTTAGDWTHHIEAGKTGKIPLQFNSGGIRGDVSRSISVGSNDKTAPTKTITIRGTIWQALEATPQFAFINIPADAPSNATSVVRIVNHTDTPVTLSDPVSASRSFKAELKTLTPGKEFQLTITALPPFNPGSSSATIAIKTSLPNLQTFTVNTMAQMQPAVRITPAQIVLKAKSDGWTTNSVAISALTSKPLSLSNPGASDTNIIVQVKEMTPGREFQLVAAFPPGYQTPPGHQQRLTVKSNRPEQPEITVNIVQIQQRSAIAAPFQARSKVASQTPPSPPDHP